MLELATETKDDRYQEIVRVAGELFAAKGFVATTLNDVASAVGILKGSLYHHINSKEELLFDVVKVAHLGVIENMKLADRFASDPKHQLAAFAYGHIVLNAVEDRIHRGIVYLQDSKHLPEAMRSQITDHRDAYDTYLRSIISRGQTSRVFDRDLDPKMSSFATFGVLTSYSRWYKPGGVITPHMIGRECAAYILAAVAAPNESAEARFAFVDSVSEEIREATPPVLPPEPGGKRANAPARSRTRR